MKYNDLEWFVASISYLVHFPLAMMMHNATNAVTVSSDHNGLMRLKCLDYTLGNPLQGITCRRYR